MNEYPASISVYHEACDEIRSWMKAGWLHQNEFDRLARQHQPVQSRVVAYTGDTVVLGGLYGDQNIALLQEMQRAKIIRARMAKSGGIEYRDEERDHGGG